MKTTVDKVRFLVKYQSGLQPANVRIFLLIKYIGYLNRILACENMFSCKAFFVSILLLKFDFNLTWILSCSCIYKKVSMYTTRCTKNRVKKASKYSIPCKTLREETSSSGGRKIPMRNQIRMWRKLWRLKIYIIFKTGC